MAVAWLVQGSQRFDEGLDHAALVLCVQLKAVLGVDGIGVEQPHASQIASDQSRYLLLQESEHGALTFPENVLVADRDKNGIRLWVVNHLRGFAVLCYFSGVLIGNEKCSLVPHE